LTLVFAGSPQCSSGPWHRTLFLAKANLVHPAWRWLTMTTVPVSAMADEHWGDPAKTSVKYGSELI